MDASYPPLYIAVIVHKYSISGLDVRSVVHRVPANQRFAGVSTADSLALLPAP